MSNTINKVVAVLNDFEMADNILGKALKFSSQQNAILEVLYVHEESLFAVPDYFRSSEHINDNLIDKDKVRKELKERILKLGFEKDCAILVFIDDTLDRVLTQTKEDKETLILIEYHKEITKKLIKKSHLPVLVIKNSATDYKNVVVPIDLGENTDGCIDLANKLFPTATKRLLHDYRYVINTTIMDLDYLGIPTTEPDFAEEINQKLKSSQVEKFEDLKKKTGLEGDFIEEKLSVEDDLTQFINEKHFNLTILCSRDEDFIFSSSISFILLETLSTDILIKYD